MVLVPFAVVGLTTISDSISRCGAYAPAGIGILLAIYSFGTLTHYYRGGYHTLGRVHNFDKIVSSIRKLKPAVIYGEADIAPARAAASGIPLMNNIIDTNVTLFRTGRYSAPKLTKDAITQQAAVITYGLEIPAKALNLPAATEIVDAKQLLKGCKIVSRNPVRAEQMANQLVLWDCSRNQ